MIKSVTITNYLGESVKITLADGDPEHGMVIKNITGLGPPKANVNLTELATMDGALYNSARIEKRNIVIQMLFTWAPKIEDSRQRTYKYFPLKKPLTFLIETDNRLIETVGYVETNEPDIFSKDESNQISILCDDPYFYAHAKSIVQFFGSEPLFEFGYEYAKDDQNAITKEPSNPFNSVTEPFIEFGEIHYPVEIAIYYDADIEVGMIIRMHALGRVNNIQIFNEMTKETMYIDTSKIESLTGYGISSGDDIIISTNRGSKSIILYRNGKNINILNCLSRNSDWLTLRSGYNYFTVVADYGLEDLIIEIENRNAYEGV